MSGSATKSSNELRRFGLSLALALSVVGGLLVWRERPAGFYLLAASALMLLAAGLFPTLLRPLEWLLTRGGRVFTAVLTYVVLTLSFLLVITPMGLLLRLLRNDLLALKPAPNQPSFWIPVEPDGPATRPDKPY